MISTPLFQIDFPNTPTQLWRYTVGAAGGSFSFAPPVFEVDGVTVKAQLTEIVPLGTPELLSSGVTEHRLRGKFAADLGLELELCFRIAPDNPVVRFRYRLLSQTPRQLTRSGGVDALTYLTVSLADLPQAKEVRFSEFNETVHSYCLAERELTEREWTNSVSAMGPLLTAHNLSESFLIAYEHGSQVPDAYLQYDLSPDRTLTLRAVKGNYCDGQTLDAAHPYETLWLQAAAVAGDEAALARAYRTFILRYQSPNAASRQPYLFYNTWAMQERGSWWRGEGCLESMTEERVLAEIEIAHTMGIEVFVLDTGWYEKTGDWQVSPTRFPNGLGRIKETLDNYGMKMGLWFNPVEAAVTSRMLQSHTDCLLTKSGVPLPPRPVWDTEASQGLCLVSRYWEAFADLSIRLVRELGVTYFKWDAIDQHSYGCDDPNHFHGTEANTREERADSYVFQQVGYMTRIIDKLCAACPEAIVDFDITEGNRSVGLSFLAAGKYFLINNGPYDTSYDMLPQSDGSNLFVRPGPARARICRTPLTFDKWIPSVLFLTHYLPDDPESSQWINLASLVLGQNGLWGDLAGVSEGGIQRIGHALRRYKEVREDITAASVIISGAVGGCPEVYEKINPETGRGVVSFFAGNAGSYTYVTRNAVDARAWHTEGVSLSYDGAGRARIDTAFTGAGAQMIFFGVSAPNPVPHKTSPPPSPS